MGREKNIYIYIAKGKGREKKGERCERNPIPEQKKAVYHAEFVFPGRVSGGLFKRRGKGKGEGGEGSAGMGGKYLNLEGISNINSIS